MGSQHNAPYVVDNIRCGSAARWDLCGGRSVMGGSTATARLALGIGVGEGRALLAWRHCSGWDLGGIVRLVALLWMGSWGHCSPGGIALDGLLGGAARLAALLWMGSWGALLAWRHCSGWALGGSPDGHLERTCRLRVPDVQKVARLSVVCDGDTPCCSKVAHIIPNDSKC